MRRSDKLVAEYRFALLALAVWVVLLAAATWFSNLQTLAGSTASGMVGALAGSFGSVVLGAFGVESWQARERRRQERAWVAINAELLGSVLSTGSQYLSD